MSKKDYLENKGVFSKCKPLNELALEIHETAVNKGFYNKEETEDQFIERMCNNLHDEISELHTAWRENKLRDQCDKKTNQFLSNLEEELADIIIRVLDNAKNLRIDIDRAVLIKMEYNKTREYRHGNKRS